MASANETDVPQRVQNRLQTLRFAHLDATSDEDDDGDRPPLPRARRLPSTSEASSFSFTSSSARVATCVLPTRSSDTKRTSVIGAQNKAKDERRATKLSRNGDVGKDDVAPRLDVYSEHTAVAGPEPGSGSRHSGQEEDQSKKYNRQDSPHGDAPSTNCSFSHASGRHAAKMKGERDTRSRRRTASVTSAVLSASDAGRPMTFWRRNIQSLFRHDTVDKRRHRHDRDERTSSAQKAQDVHGDKRYNARRAVFASRNHRAASSGSAPTIYERGLHVLALKQQHINDIRAAMEERSRAEMTFQPIISSHAKKLTHRLHPASETFSHEQVRKRVQLLELPDEDGVMCFTPRISRHSREIVERCRGLASTSMPPSERLYRDHVARSQSSTGASHETPIGKRLLRSREAVAAQIESMYSFERKRVESLQRIREERCAEQQMKPPLHIDVTDLVQRLTLHSDTTPTKLPVSESEFVPHLTPRSHAVAATAREHAAQRWFSFFATGSELHTDTLVNTTDCNSRHVLAARVIRAALLKAAPTRSVWNEVDFVRALTDDRDSQAVQVWNARPTRKEDYQSAQSPFRPTIDIRSKMLMKGRSLSATQFTNTTTRLFLRAKETQLLCRQEELERHHQRLEKEARETQLRLLAQQRSAPRQRLWPQGSEKSALQLTSAISAQATRVDSTRVWRPKQQDKATSSSVETNATLVSAHRGWDANNVNKRAEHPKDVPPNAEHVMNHAFDELRQLLDIQSPSSHQRQCKITESTETRNTTRHNAAAFTATYQMPHDDAEDNVQPHHLLKTNEKEGYVGGMDQATSDLLLTCSSCLDPSVVRADLRLAVEAANRERLRNLGHHLYNQRQQTRGRQVLIQN